jgi:CBS domain-containing protein
VYDYVAGKEDWFANGLPREGKDAEAPWAGDLARDDVPTCAPEESLGELRDRVLESGYDFCLVLNEQRVVLGLLRGDALAKEPGAQAEEVMELGPVTIRANEPVEELLASRSDDGVKYWVVTDGHGVLLGVVDRADAERGRG